MSVAAVKWAYLQDTDRSTSTFILVTLGNLVQVDDERWEVFASVDFLASVTRLNRKTVIEALKRLRDAGLIQDTGRLAGPNHSVPIYRLARSNTAAQEAVPGHPPFPGQGALEYAGAAGQRLPAAWTLPATWRAWTRKQRPTWSNARIDSVAAIFHARWSSDTSERAAQDDWYATWRLWVLNEREDEPQDDDTTEAPKPDFGAMGASVRAAMKQQHLLGTGAGAGNHPGPVSDHAQKRDSPKSSPASTENGTGASTENGTGASTENGTQ